MRKTTEKQSICALAMAMAAAAGGAAAQTSSLHDRDAGQSDQVAADRYGYSDDEAVRDDGPRLNPEVARYTSVYARRPDPDRYGVNDLVTIVVRESFDTQLESEASSEKSIDYIGGIRELPRLSLSDLLDLQIRPNTFPDGRVELDVGYESEFEGEGEYARSETMTGRITARVVDIRPNGTLVLEARKTLVNDGEEVSIVATGICRVQDITPDNTVLSTQLYDLFIDKQHEGELKDSTEKGFLSRLLDFVFPF
ncbi:flagellar basal body L-ring protein FlgH [Phycisphaeraceae bacterium D3-23]